MVSTSTICKPLKNSFDSFIQIEKFMENGREIEVSDFGFRSTFKETWEAHQGIKEGKTNGACKGIISFWGAKAKALEGPYEALSSSSCVCLCNSLVPGRSSAAQLWILHPHQEEKSAGLEQDLILGFSRNNKAKPS